ncbi:MAG: ABC transporter ATP-binding protein [Alphaproteobacteria bacterium]|nr:ABC transporter ATP-binding protein [Alphaproteobacteria bacterium]
MIEVRDLVKRFHAPFRGTVTAVDHLSFEVRPGEVYGLLGPNGAGKTTTLKMLATLVRPDGGTVRVDGVDAVADPLGARGRLAYVPAEAGVPPQLSPREVVRLYADVQGVPQGRRRADELLERLGATSYADTPCGELSTGMKRRVVLARALVHEPQVLMLDEPTDGLDVLGRRDVLALVREQAAAGRTVVISSHIMVEVERVVDRLGVVAHGRLTAEGTLAHVLAHAKAANLDDAFVTLAHGERAS